MNNQQWIVDDPSIVGANLLQAYPWFLRYDTAILGSLLGCAVLSLFIGGSGYYLSASLFVGSFIVYILAQLVAHWFAGCNASLRFQRVEAVTDASHMLVHHSDGRQDICALQSFRVNTLNREVNKQSSSSEPQQPRPNQVSFVEHRKTRYFLCASARALLDGDTRASPQHDRFRPCVLPEGLTVNECLASKGLTSSQVHWYEQLFGRNEFDIPVPTARELLKEQALAPLFVFQVFCVLLWLMDEYWYYALFTLVLLVMFEFVMARQRVQTIAGIREVRIATFDIYVFRHGKWRCINSGDLLMGDICSITAVRADDDDDQSVGRQNCCDALLLRGTVVTDESMLTGESVPQRKEHVTRTAFSTSSSSSSSSSGSDGVEVADSEIKNDVKVEVGTDGAQGGLLRSSTLFGGTAIVSHSSASAEFKHNQLAGIPDPPDRGSVALVLATGFRTQQGRLIQTLVYSSERATANNRESFIFIGILVVFALCASSYVLYHGWHDESRSRYKLLLNCIMIITSVVPPELPLELTLAVNNSLVALRKLLVYCTEPFRIPFAGNVDVCCFDKTGTLTEDTFLVAGVVGLNEHWDPSMQPTAPQDCPLSTKLVLGGCHSLLMVPRSRGSTGVVGDPLEQEAFRSLRTFSLSRDDVVVSSDDARCVIQVTKRFVFHSSLRRMSVLASVKTSRSTGLRHLALLKGAAEVVRGFLTQVPEHYDACFAHYSRMGYRVLALAWKELLHMGPSTSKANTKKKLLPSDSKNEKKLEGREATEDGLTFAGFLVMRCPIKPGSADVCRQLIDASHRVVMVTGDHILTAAHVAAELSLCNRGPSRTLLLTKVPSKEAKHGLCWHSIDETRTLPLDVATLAQQADSHDFCITGEGLDALRAVLSERDVSSVVAHAVVFARTSPIQKEAIVKLYKKRGLVVSMCGDGTNDVGALKHAHVGLALLSSKLSEELAGGKNKHGARPLRKAVAPSGTSTRRRRQIKKGGGISEEEQRALENALNEAAAGAPQPVRLGDASIAASFTSRVPHVRSIVSVVQQGRCTLVTTYQMYRILALNSLVSSYCMSVLYLGGLKMSDTQMTFFSLALSGYFLFLSRSKPLPTLSRERPQNSLFAPGTLLSLCMQFGMHLYCLVQVAAMCNEFTPATHDHRGSDSDFLPNVTNTAVFLLYSSMTCANFIANYHGEPFMEPMRSNSGLWWMLYGSLAALFVLAGEVVPELNEYLELAPLPSAEVQLMLIGYMLLDVISCVWIQKIMGRIFRNRPALSRQALTRPPPA